MEKSNKTSQFTYLSFKEWQAFNQIKEVQKQQYIVLNKLLNQQLKRDDTIDQIYSDFLPKKYCLNLKFVQTNSGTSDEMEIESTTESQDNFKLDYQQWFQYQKYLQQQQKSLQIQYQKTENQVSGENALGPLQLQGQNSSQSMENENKIDLILSNLPPYQSLKFELFKYEKMSSYKLISDQQNCTEYDFNSPKHNNNENYYCKNSNNQQQNNNQNSVQLEHLKKQFDSIYIFLDNLQMNQQQQYQITQKKQFQKQEQKKPIENMFDDLFSNNKDNNQNNNIKNNNNNNSNQTDENKDLDFESFFLIGKAIQKKKPQHQKINNNTLKYKQLKKIPEKSKKDFNLNEIFQSPTIKKPLQNTQNRINNKQQQQTEIKQKKEPLKIQIDIQLTKDIVNNSELYGYVSKFQKYEQNQENLEKLFQIQWIWCSKRTYSQKHIFSLLKLAKQDEINKNYQNY